MSNFLTDSQVAELNDKEWFVKPKGSYIDLYRTDFTDDSIWREVCDQVGASYDCEYVTILYFGVKTK
jgi:hypothetical protein